MSASRRPAVAAETDARDTTAWEQSASGWEWLRTNPEVLAEHAGHWICVVDGQIVISETDDRAFQERVRRDGLAKRGALVMRVPPIAEWQEVEVPAE